MEYYSSDEVHGFFEATCYQAAEQNYPAQVLYVYINDNTLVPMLTYIKVFDTPLTKKDIVFQCSSLTISFTFFHFFQTW